MPDPDLVFVVEYTDAIGGKHTVGGYSRFSMSKENGTVLLSEGDAEHPATLRGLILSPNSFGTLTYWTVPRIDYIETAKAKENPEVPAQGPTMDDAIEHLKEVIATEPDNPIFIQFREMVNHLCTGISIPISREELIKNVMDLQPYKES